MTTTNEKLRNVAEIAARIMMGEKALHPNQQKLDVHEPEKDKLTAKDFEMLRAGKKAPEVKKEAAEQIDEVSLKTATSAYVKRVGRDETGADPKAAKTISHIANRYGVKGVARAAKSADKEYGLNDPVHNKRKDFVKGVMADVKKEEVDQAAEFVLEYESKDGKFVHRAKPGVYGGTKDEKHAVDTLKGPKMKELSDIEAEKKKKKKMSEMVALYQEQGLKGLFASLVKEEPDNEQFTKELEAQKAKNAGQGKKAEVAKAEVLAVQEEEFEVVMNEPNGYAEATIEERSMTEPEIKKKEEIVKSMKKGISGFKDRYGDRAKNVMYATATKRAMGEEVEQIEEGTPEGYQRRDGKLIPKIHPTMTPHEHGYDYTMQSIEDAPSKAKIHSQHKEIVKDNPHPQGSKEHKDWEAGTNKAKADHLKDFS
jgi:hypothetical protein